MTTIEIAVVWEGWSGPYMNCAATCLAIQHLAIPLPYPHLVMLARCLLYHQPWLHRLQIAASRARHHCRAYLRMNPDVDSDVTIIIDPNKATDVTASSQSTGVDSLPQTQGDKPTLRSNIYTVPPRRKKKTKIEVTTKAMTNILCEQLRKMDSDWQSQEDARLQKFMDNERELQRNLVTQMVVMQDKISSENREFLGQLVSKMTSTPQFTNTHSDLQSHSHTAFGPKTRYAQQGQSPTSFGPISQYMQQAQSPPYFGPRSQYTQQSQSPTTFGDTHQFTQQSKSPTTFGDTHQFVQQSQSPTSFNSTLNTLKNRPRGSEFGDSFSSTTPVESTPSNKPQYQIL
ncbi:uncharacterized protein LOC134956991 [Pseudophryne corroboree]|uniref:uncharacterized protein LOC134956991 n=1 Tax=Pseudophryne corroboree TaxID=495146 RepID=UPI00308129FF